MGIVKWRQYPSATTVHFYQLQQTYHAWTNIFIVTSDSKSVVTSLSLTELALALTNLTDRGTL